MKTLILFSCFVSFLFSDSKLPEKKITPPNTPKTFVDSIQPDFQEFKDSYLTKYSFYLSAQDCISKSNSKQDIRACENVLRTKLSNFSKQEASKNASNQQEYLKLKSSMDSKPEFKPLPQSDKSKSEKDSKK